MRTLLALGLVILLAAACNSGPDLDQPPTIRYGEDSCERCLMIINEARFAAAYVTADGTARRFDDIGGMLAYDAEMHEDVAVYWVHDFDSEEWLKAEEAHFVKSDEQITPMGFGIVAFDDHAQAEEWAAEREAMVMDFSQLAAAGTDEGGEHNHEDE